MNLSYSLSRIIRFHICFRNLFRPYLAVIPLHELSDILSSQCVGIRKSHYFKLGGSLCHFYLIAFYPDITVCVMAASGEHCFVWYMK